MWVSRPALDSGCICKANPKRCTRPNHIHSTTNWSRPPTAYRWLVACLVCRGDLLDEEALTCSACREFAVGRRLHIGHQLHGLSKPVAEVAAAITQLDELAHAYGVPPPLQPEDWLGSWAHFVQALHAYNCGEHGQALGEARQALMLKLPRGWKGLADHASIIAKASEEALTGGARRLPRRYMARLEVNFPSIPTNADFASPGWRKYEEAVEHLRAQRFKEANAAIYEGLNQLGGPKSDDPIAWFLRQLGKASKLARRPPPRFELHAQPSRPQDLLTVFGYFNINLPNAFVLEDPAWSALARAWIAFDNGAWQATYAHIEVARSLVPVAPEQRPLRNQLIRLEQKVPVMRRAAHYAIRRKGRIHIPSFARTRQALGEIR